MKKIFFVIATILLLSSCANMNSNVSHNNQKSQKIATLKYEMARNIIAHKDFVKLADAFSYLNDAIKINPNDPRFYYTMALAYKLRNNDKQYVIYLNKAIEKDKNYFDAFNALGIYYYSKKFYTRAIDMFTKLTNNPLYHNADVAFFNRSRVYLTQNKIEEAENDLESALMFSNYKNKIYWQNLISLQISQKEYYIALKNLFQMERTLRPSCYTHYYKALCYEKLSLFDQAKDELKKISNDNLDYLVLKRRLLKEIEKEQMQTK